MANSENPSTEELLRQTSRLEGPRWGTSAPFRLGDVRIERVGYANLAVAECTTQTPNCDAVVAVVRQHVFGELEAQGVPNEALEFVPTVGAGDGRRCNFVDQNESSPTLGKNRIGLSYCFRFHIRPEFVKLFEFDSFGHGKVKS